MLNNTSSKLTLTSIAVVTMLFASQADARGKDRQKGAKQDPAQRLSAKFQRLDSNEDELLEFTELLTPAQAKAERKFNRKDANEDGFLSFDEAYKMEQPVDLSEIADEIVLCVEETKLDNTDDNIVVPDAESFVSPIERFNNLDTSEDGVLNIDEVLAGTVTRVTKRFSQADVDASTTLDSDEYSQAKLQSHATRKAVKACIEELSEDEIL